MPIGSLSRRYLGGAFWSLLGSGVSQAATLLTAVIAARLLGSVRFGEYGIIQSTTGMLGILAGMGLGITATKYVSELRASDPVRCGRIIGLSNSVALMSASAIALGLWLVAPWLASGVLQAPHLTLGLRIAGALLIFSTLNGVQIGTLTGFEAFRTVLYINIFRAAATLVLVTAGVLKWELPGMFVGMTLAAALTCLVSYFAERSTCRTHAVHVSHRQSRREVKLLWRFTLPGLIALLLPGIVFWVVRTILVRSSDGYAELGTFTAAEQWTTAITFLSAGLNTVGLPILSNTYATSNWTQFRKAVIGNLSLTLGAAILVATVVALASPWIAAVYGPTYSDMAPVLILIAFVSVLRVLGGTIGNFIASIDEMWWAVAFNLLWTVTLIIGAYLLVDRGALGLAMAYLIAYAAQATWAMAFFFVRLGRLRRQWRSL